MPDPNPNATPAGGKPHPRLFATTHWSVVRAAGRQDEAQAAAAIERLCRDYWYPLYAYVRRRGYRPEDAQDLTQCFFARLLERDLLARASPERGRFRSFLLRSLQNFLADEHDRAVARKRDPGQPVLAWDAMDAEARYALEPSGEVSPDRLFDRRWATTVLEQAWTLLEAEYVADPGEIDQEIRHLLRVLGTDSRAARFTWPMEATGCRSWIDHSGRYPVC